MSPKWRNPINNKKVVSERWDTHRHIHAKIMEKVVEIIAGRNNYEKWSWWILRYLEVSLICCWIITFGMGT